MILSLQSYPMFPLSFLPTPLFPMPSFLASYSLLTLPLFTSSLLSDLFILLFPFYPPFLSPSLVPRHTRSQCFASLPLFLYSYFPLSSSLFVRFHSQHSSLLPFLYPYFPTTSLYLFLYLSMST